MFFNLSEVKNEKSKADYNTMMAELNEFYEINWVENLPKVFFLNSRKQIDSIRKCKTSDWVVGWTDNTNVYVLKNGKMTSESSHKKHSKDGYYALIKHELSHIFFNILSGFPRWHPKWLWEGTAIYTSGQNSFKKKVDKFNDFLNFYDQESVKDVYRESGFAVEILVNKFGKEKLLNLIKNLKNYQSKELFEQAFEKEYGFLPTYEKFNSLIF
jgi:hypothetical protein